MSRVVDEIKGGMGAGGLEVDISVYRAANKCCSDLSVAIHNRLPILHLCDILSWGSQGKYSVI